MPNTAPPAPTFAELSLERLETGIAEYRELVCKRASGWTLAKEDRRRACRLLARVGLPRWAFDRDTIAARAMWAAESEHRKRELLILHPHLFAEVRQWATLHQADTSRRRQVLAEIRQAAAGE
jgi:hypothetical protein